MIRDDPPPGSEVAPAETLRQVLDLLPDASQCGHLLTTLAGRVLGINRLAAEWCGRGRDEIEGRLQFAELLSPGSRIFHQTHCLPLLELQGFAHEISLDLRTPSGAVCPVLANARLRPARDGSPALVSIVLFNATATRRHERELRAARRAAEASTQELALRNAQLQVQGERLRVTLQAMTDAVVTTDAAGRVDSLNPAALALLGEPAAQLLGRPFDQAVALGRADVLLPTPSPVSACLQQRKALREADAALLLRADGALRHVEHTVAPLFDGEQQLIGAVWVCRDVTEQHRLAERIDRDLRHDTTTGLPNRREFERLLGQASTAVDAAGRGDLVCFIDIDQLKVVNDTAGHTAGDALIVAIAGLLKASVRHGDTLARLGGDEFGLLLAGCTPADGIARAEALGERIAAHRFEWKRQLHAVTASIGIAALWRTDGPPAAALGDADVACQAAKEAGRNRVVFAADADARISHRRGEMQWVPVLRRALAEDRFVLFIQPIVACTEPLAPASHGELLLRLRGDDGQLVAPGLFIPAAERYQLMGELDRCVLRKALAWMRVRTDVRCSINVSGQSLGDQGFLAHVVAELDAQGVDPARVCFEITETAAIANLAAAQRFIATLRARGARFALDDFGAGLSSFAYLRQLQVDVVKIDGSFVKRMHDDAQNRSIVESIHRVARVSGLSTVAEWVEDEAVLAALVDIGVDHAQGYGVGRPIELSQWPGPVERKEERAEKR